MGTFVLCAFELSCFTVGTGLHVGLAGKTDSEGSEAAASIGRKEAVTIPDIFHYITI